MYKRDRRVSNPSVIKTLRIFQMEGMKSEIADKRGYDILLGDGKKVEVKFDTWIISTGNVAAEWWVHPEDPKKRMPGWAQYSDADILVYMYDFDNAYVLQMQPLLKFIRENVDRFVQKKAFPSGALNLMVPILEVQPLRMKEFEDLFRRHAVVPPKD